MPRDRHQKPTRPIEEEKSETKKAEIVKQKLESGGFKVREVQFWKKNKLSDAIRKIIKPYEHDADSYDSYESLVGFACTAWNAALVEEPERSKMMDDFLKIALKRRAPQQARLEMRNFVGEMIERKLKLYPKDDRFIVNFELEDRGDDFYLSVASAIPVKDE